MKMKNANMPAAPVTDPEGMPFNDTPGEQCTIGLTKREYFAGLAMQGICANSTENSPAGMWEVVARDAVKAADALLAELEKEPEQ